MSEFECECAHSGVARAQVGRRAVDRTVCIRTRLRGTKSEEDGKRDTHTSTNNNELFCNFTHHERVQERTRKQEDNRKREEEGKTRRETTKSRHQGQRDVHRGEC